MIKKTVEEKKDEKHAKFKTEYRMDNGAPYPFIDYEDFWKMAKDIDCYKPRHFIELMENDKEIIQGLAQREGRPLNSRMMHGYLERDRSQPLLNLFGHVIGKKYRAKYSGPVSVLDYLKANHERLIKIESMLEEILKK
jgi:hypothetical protein